MFFPGGIFNLSNEWVEAVLLGRTSLCPYAPLIILVTSRPGRKEPKANGNEMQEKEIKKKSENRFLEKKKQLALCIH